MIDAESELDLLDVEFADADTVGRLAGLEAEVAEMRAHARRRRDHSVLRTRCRVEQEAFVTNVK